MTEVLKQTGGSWAGVFQVFRRLPRVLPLRLLGVQIAAAAHASYLMLLVLNPSHLPGHGGSVGTLWNLKMSCAGRSCRVLPSVNGELVKVNRASLSCPVTLLC